MLARAIATIGRVMELGTTTHPDDDWRDYRVRFHVARAERHLRLLRKGDASEPHLEHAACRLLMALELTASAVQVKVRPH